MPCRQQSQLGGATGFGGGAGGFATEAECLAACKEGACCTGTKCTVKPQCQCDAAAGEVFKGVGTVCGTAAVGWSKSRSLVISGGEGDFAAFNGRFDMSPRYSLPAFNASGCANVQWAFSDGIPYLPPAGEFKRFLTVQLTVQNIPTGCCTSLGPLIASLAIQAMYYPGQGTAVKKVLWPDGVAQGSIFNVVNVCAASQSVVVYSQQDPLLLPAPDPSLFGLLDFSLSMLAYSCDTAKFTGGILSLAVEADHPNPLP